MTELLSIPQAARLIGWSDMTLRRAIRAGLLQTEQKTLTRRGINPDTLEEFKLRLQQGRLDLDTPTKQKAK